MRVMDELNNLIEGYLKGDLDYRAFRASFAPVSLDIERSGDSHAIALCGAVEYQCADFSEELISENDIRNRLALLAASVSQGSSTNDNMSMVIFASVVNQPNPIVRVEQSSSSNSLAVPYSTSGSLSHFANALK